METRMRWLRNNSTVVKFCFYTEHRFFVLNLMTPLLAYSEKRWALGNWSLNVAILLRVEADSRWFQVATVWWRKISSFVGREYSTIERIRQFIVHEDGPHSFFVCFFYYWAKGTCCLFRKGDAFTNSTWWHINMHFADNIRICNVEDGIINLLACCSSLLDVGLEKLAFF